MELPQSEILLCKDTRRDEFLETVKDAGETDPNLELLVVHVASHGIPDGDRLYLATTASNGRHDLFHALSIDELFAAMSLSPAVYKLLFIDSCFSGAAVGVMGDQAAPPAPVPVPHFRIGGRRSGVFVVTSCSGTEVSYAPVGDRYTVFTEALIQSLQGQPGEGTHLSPKQISDQVQRKIADRARDQGRQYPQPRYQDSDGIGDTPLFRNLAAPPPAEAQDDEPLANYRILIVDDDAGALKDLTDLVTNLKVRHPDLRLDIVPHTDDLKAQNALRSSFDLAIFNLFLASGSAAALLNNAKEHSPNTRAIVLTRSTMISPGDLDEALPAIINFPPAVHGFLIKGKEQALLRNVIRDEASRRTHIVDLVEGIEPFVSDVVDRLEKRRRIPAGVTNEALAAESRAAVAGLFARWLDPDAWAEDVEQLVTSFELTPIDEGLSSCVVYQAQAVVAASGGVAPARMAIKLGPRSEIDQELERYHRYVEVGIPLKQRTDLVQEWLGRNIGGILFSFIGDAGRFARQNPVQVGAAGRVQEIIVNLFAPSGISWYSAKGLRRQQLFEYYDQFQFGMRQALEAVDDLQRSVGKIAGDGRGTGALPMPERQWLAKEVLNHSWPTTLVHGDLHLGNVVYLGSESFAVIDYRNVGPGPRCVDFAVAELSLLLATEQPDLPQAQLVQEYMAWMEATDLDGRTAGPIPGWLRETAGYVATLRGFLLDTFQTAVMPGGSTEEGVTGDEFFACLFVVALRRSRFRGLAKGRAEERRERVVMAGTVLACARKLGIVP